ncbi:MAG: hypothetical protein KME42_15425 [Tildeniella nuda ZEHNDER 1965/U140]|jgi:hypothetical protein|nr:hypothetical protein [Tildeniella nuda ZEHNDER 1965/U140]
MHPMQCLRKSSIFAFSSNNERQPTKAETSAASVPHNNGILDLLKRVEAIQAQVPPEEWDNLPHGGSINHDHYLYGAPKVEE